MTDDLFDDFDLQDGNKQDEFAGKVETAVADEDENAAETEINSKEMHPDIFSVNEVGQENISDDEIRHLSEMIDAEKSPAEKVFSFSDEEKIPFASNADYIQEELVVEVRTIDKIRRPDVVIDPENYGDTLRRMREDVCVSLADLAEELKIKESFLAALEREDYDNLPPEVFVIAYIRKLGGVYHLTEEEIVSLSSKVRARMEIDLPDDMDKVVTLYEHSEENDDKIRHIITLFCVLIVIILLLIGSGVYFFVSGRKAADTAGKNIHQNRRHERFSSDTLLELQPQVKLDAPVLKITK
ncbi:MAG: helix-turn-helix domain-containing protein [Lentisphaeria bacterium]|nr:helix-turn-helix domain-containing protein [Lentisphaeria bacterium]